MRKSLLLAVCAVSVIAMTSVQAIEVKKPEVGALKNVTSTVSNATSLTPTAARGMISEINSKLSVADNSLQSAFSTLTSTLLSKEEAVKIETQLNAIKKNKNLSAAEKSTQLANVVSDCGKILEENQKELGEKLKTANDATREKYAKAAAEEAVAIAEYLDIAKDCTVTGLSISKDPKLAVTLAPEITSLKDTGILLKNNVKSLQSVNKQIKAIAKAGNVEIKTPKETKSKTSKVDLTKVK